MDYAGLLSQVVDTLDGQVTEDQVAALIPLVEARFNRTINSPRREVEATTAPTDDVTIPDDCWQLRDVWLAGSPDRTLEQMGPDQARTLYGNQTGNPVAYVVSGRTLDLWPTPTASSDGVVHIRYQQAIPALGTGNTSNWLISSHPDIYYYALLIQCEAFIANDERAVMWKAALDEALGELTDLNRRQRYGAAPLVRKPYSCA